MFGLQPPRHISTLPLFCCSRLEAAKMRFPMQVGKAVRASRACTMEAIASAVSNDYDSQFANGIVSSVSFVSTTNTARSLAGFVLPALALTTWRSPGSSEKLSSAL
jgi:hypothetical protein